MIAPVALQLDRKREWRFSAGAVIALHRALGKNAFKRLDVFRPKEGEADGDFQQRGLEDLAECLEVFVALLWCGLVGEDRTLTMEAVGEMVSPRSMTELLPVLMESASKVMSENPTHAPSLSGAVPTAATGSTPGPSVA